jgi:predicted N-acetyltransferase YhbS
MQEGLARAKARGHRLVILVGDAPYYARVGFQKVPEGKLILPGPVNPERFLYVELMQGALAEARGLVLPPHRFAEISAPLAVPHQAERQKQSAERQ